MSSAAALADNDRAADTSSAFRRLPHYQPMVLIVLAMISGIACDAQLDFPWWSYLICVAVAGAGWLFFRVPPLTPLAELSSLSQTTNPITITQLRRRETLASCCLLLVVGALTAGWQHGRWNWFGPEEIGTYAGTTGSPIAVEGFAVTEPRWLAPADSVEELDYRAGTVRTQVTLQVSHIRHGQHWQPASGKLDLIIHAPTEHLSAGDEVRVFGRLAPIGPPSNPGQFDFQNFYRASQKMASLHCYYPECAEVIQPARWWSSQWLSGLRKQLNAITWQYINADEAAFASAILLGNREQLAPERRELFLQTGTIHLLAISGLHVGILAGSFFLLFRIGLASRRDCLYVTIAFVIFYAWLVEFRPPVTRAAILIVLFCVARLLGEKNFSYNLLAIAGIIVLALNPLDLFSLGAQLSFLAVGSLNFGKDWVFWPPPRDPIKRLIASSRSTPMRIFNWAGQSLRTAFLVSGLIWCVALPLVANRFHLVATVALLVNPLLLIPIAWGLYGGLGVLVFGWFLPPVAIVCGKFCQWNLSLIEWMIGVAQSLPYSHCWTAGPTTIAVLVFYLGLFFSVIFPPTRLRLKTVVLLAIGWLLFGWSVPDWVLDWRKRQTENPLVCTFIDVGHGTSVLLELPDGKNMLYDAGSFGSSNYGFRNIAGVLWNRRIERLDAVVISHADTDHFNALPELSRRFSIDEVIVSPQMLASEAPAVRSVLVTLRQRSIPVRAVDEETPDAIHPTISILNPPHTGTGGGDNSDSLVLSVNHAGQTILLPGDLEDAGMTKLLTRSALDTDLVMAPHHGSINSDPSEFMRWATPETVVISGGTHKIKPQVVEIFRQQGRSVFRTDRDGAVRYTINGDVSKIENWNRNGWQEVR